MNPDPAPLTLNSVLQADGIDPGEVLVFRHRPWEAELNKVFDWIVAERRDLYDCYQSTHAANTEAALKRARYLVSCIRYKPKKALFVGLYEVRSQRLLSVDGYQGRPLHRELMRLGMGGHKASDGRESVIEFDMVDTAWRLDWSQRLVIGWPGLERSWYRWADRNVFPIEAIAEEDLLAGKMPDWQELSLEWNQLSVLPRAWRAALAQWRGIYLIVDRSDGQQYVGSAYGSDNILQRWENYAATGHGGNKLLSSRDKENFVFAILERVSPDLQASDVISLENTWKVRLRSRSPDGLNEN